MINKDIEEIPFEEPLPKPRVNGWKTTEKPFQFYIDLLLKRYDEIPEILYDLLKDCYNTDIEKFQEIFYKSYDKELIEYCSINYNELKNIN